MIRTSLMLQHGKKNAAQRALCAAGVWYAPMQTCVRYNGCEAFL